MPVTHAFVSAIPDVAADTAAGKVTPTRWNDDHEGSNLEVLDEGVSLDAAVTSIDVVGAGVTATAVGHAVTLTVPAATDDQTAAEVPFTPVGTIAATDTQAAVAEVATDAASALSTHAGAADPHPGYLTQPQVMARSLGC